MTKTRLLFLAILIEGYAVLAIELLAIRQLLPFVGSGTEVVAIVIGGVLMSLAVGYDRGGRALQSAHRFRKRRPTIRGLLVRNLLIALVFLFFGISYFIIDLFYSVLATHGLTNRLAFTAIYTATFIVTPVYLLGQTVPLISNYFSRRRLSEITGRMLFFSTLGAFFGSIVSTLVLMMTIGVHNTVIVTIALLGFLCLLLSRRKRWFTGSAVAIILLITYAFNSNHVYRTLNFVSDNAYNLAQVTKWSERDAMVLLLNRSPASILSDKPENQVDYFKFIQNAFIDNLPTQGMPKDVLMIGAGGLIIGRNDRFNNYTIVDIDPEMQKIAENDFLHEKITPNKHFVPSSARAFLRQNKDKYDLIIVDVFQNTYAIPAECTTREFLVDLKNHLKENGALTVNTLASMNFADKFSARYARTFADVFPIHDRHVTGVINPWMQPAPAHPLQGYENVIYTFINTPITRDNTVYSDDKNTFSIDRP